MQRNVLFEFGQAQRMSKRENSIHQEASALAEENVENLNRLQLQWNALENYQRRIEDDYKRIQSDQKSPLTDGDCNAFLNNLDPANDSYTFVTALQVMYGVEKVVPIVPTQYYDRVCYNNDTRQKSSGTVKICNLMRNERVPFYDYREKNPSEIAILNLTLKSLSNREFFHQLELDDSSSRIKIVRIISQCEATFTPDQWVFLSQVIDPVESQIIYNQIAGEIVGIWQKKNPGKSIVVDEALSWWFNVEKKALTPPIEVTFAADFTLASVSDVLEVKAKNREQDRNAYAYVVGIAPYLPRITSQMLQDVVSRSTSRLLSLPLHPVLSSITISSWLDMVNHPERGIIFMKSGPNYEAISLEKKKMFIRAILEYQKWSLDLLYARSGFQSIDDLLKYVDFGKDGVGWEADSSSNEVFFDLNNNFVARPDMQFQTYSSSDPTLRENSLQRFFTADETYMSAPPSTKNRIVEFVKSAACLDIVQMVLNSTREVQVIFIYQEYSEKHAANINTYENDKEIKFTSLQDYFKGFQYFRNIADEKSPSIMIETWEDIKLKLSLSLIDIKLPGKGFTIYRVNPILVPNIPLKYAKAKKNTRSRSSSDAQAYFKEYNRTDNKKGSRNDPLTGLIRGFASFNMNLMERLYDLTQENKSTDVTSNEWRDIFVEEFSRYLVEFLQTATRNVPGSSSDESKFFFSILTEWLFNSRQQNRFQLNIDSVLNLGWKETLASLANLSTNSTLDMLTGPDVELIQFFPMYSNNTLPDEVSRDTLRLVLQRVVDRLLLLIERAEFRCLPIGFYWLCTLLHPGFSFRSDATVKKGISVVSIKGGKRVLEFFVDKSRYSELFTGGYEDMNLNSNEDSNMLKGINSLCTFIRQNRMISDKKLDSKLYNFTVQFAIANSLTIQRETLFTLSREGDPNMRQDFESILEKYKWSFGTFYLNAYATDEMLRNQVDIVTGYYQKHFKDAYKSKDKPSVLFQDSVFNTEVIFRVISMMMGELVLYGEFQMGKKDPNKVQSSSMGIRNPEYKTFDSQKTTAWLEILTERSFFGLAKILKRRLREDVASSISYDGILSLIEGVIETYNTLLREGKIIEAFDFSSDNEMAHYTLKSVIDHVMVMLNRDDVINPHEIVVSQRYNNFLRYIVSTENHVVLGEKTSKTALSALLGHRDTIKKYVEELNREIEARQSDYQLKSTRLKTLEIQENSKAQCDEILSKKIIDTKGAATVYDLDRAIGKDELQSYRYDIRITLKSDFIVVHAIYPLANSVDQDIIMTSSERRGEFIIKGASGSQFKTENVLHTRMHYTVQANLSIDSQYMDSIMEDARKRLRDGKEMTEFPLFLAHNVTLLDDKIKTLKAMVQVLGGDATIRFDSFMTLEFGVQDVLNRIGSLNGSSLQTLQDSKILASIKLIYILGVDLIFVKDLFERIKKITEEQIFTLANELIKQKYSAFKELEGKRQALSSIKNNWQEIIDSVKEEWERRSNRGMIGKEDILRNIERILIARYIESKKI